MFAKTILAIALLTPSLLTGSRAFAADPGKPGQMKLPACYNEDSMHSGARQGADSTRGIAVFLTGGAVTSLLRNWQIAYHDKRQAEEVAIVISPVMPRSALTFLHQGKACEVWSVPTPTMLEWLHELPPKAATRRGSADRLAPAPTPPRLDDFGPTL